MDPRRRRRLKALLVVLALLLALGADLARAPQDQVSARFLLGAIHLYQATLSPRLGSLGVRCRFQPTCSRYAEGAIRKHGAWTGSWKTAWRILRCGPWTPAGTVDPP
jgi:putative membrane protein insertion efficiency factor